MLFDTTTPTATSTQLVYTTKDGTALEPQPVTGKDPRYHARSAPEDAVSFAYMETFGDDDQAHTSATHLINPTFLQGRTLPDDHAKHGCAIVAMVKGVIICFGRRRGIPVYV